MAAVLLTRAMVIVQGPDATKRVPVVGVLPPRQSVVIGSRPDAIERVRRNERHEMRKIVRLLCVVGAVVVLAGCSTPTRPGRHEIAKARPRPPKQRGL